MARRRLEPHHRLRFTLLQRREPRLQLTDPTAIAERADLPQQYRCRDPSRPRMLNSLP